MRQAAPPTALDGIVWNVSRHKCVLVGTTLLVFGLVALVTFLIPRTYRSEALLLVRLGRENVTLEPTTVLGQATVVTVPPSRENDLNSILELLRSRSLVEDVLDRVGAD